MKKQWKKAVSIGCVACMLASTMPMGLNLMAEAQEIETQSDSELFFGTWGTCTWQLKNGVLTISGGTAESLGNYGAPWRSVRKQIQEVHITGNITFTGSNISLKHLFEECSNMVRIEGLDKMDTSRVTDMSGMFLYCSKLRSLDVSHFNTENVTDMSYMFGVCANLKKLDVSDFDTGNVTSMEGMFTGCENLRKLDVSHFNTENVTTMYCLFEGCKNLPALDVSNFCTENVTNMGCMFYHCNKITELDVSGFHTGRLENTYLMFGCCFGLSGLDIGNFDMGGVTDSNHMFDSSNLTDITVPGNFNADQAFTDALSEGMKLGKWKDVTDNISYEAKPDEFKAGHRYVLEKIMTVSGNWGNCEWVWEDGTLTIHGGIAQSTKDCPFISGDQLLQKEDIQKVNIDGNITFEEDEVSLQGMFENCMALTEINGLDKIDMSKVTNIAEMFFCCSSLKAIDMSGWDISGLQNYGRVFRECKFDLIKMPAVLGKSNEKAFVQELIIVEDADAARTAMPRGGFMNNLSEGLWRDITAGNDYEGIPDMLEQGHTYANTNIYQKQMESEMGITIRKQNGSLFDADMELNVSDVTTNEDYANYADIADKLGNTNLMYDIALEKDGEAIQPDGKILVSIPLPDDMSEEARVYCINEDGTATDMDAVFADGYLTFATNHFSVYAVVEKNAIIGDVNGDGTFNMADAALVRRYVANLNVTIDTSAADVNKDGKIDMVDYALMRRALANWDVELK